MLHPFLYIGGSIYENISYGVPEEVVDKEKIQALCKEIGIDDFINTLPNGYDTLLTDSQLFLRLIAYLL